MLFTERAQSRAKPELRLMPACIIPMSSGVRPAATPAMLENMVILNNPDSTAKQLPVSGVGLNPHLAVSSRLTDNVHIKNGDKTVPRLLKYPVIVCVVKHQTSQLKLLPTLKNRKLYLKTHGVGFDVFDDSVKLCVVNVDV